MDSKWSPIPWSPIEDLPSDWKSLVTPELANFATIWREQSVKLEMSGSLRSFNESLSREWAIETGIIEGLYTLDRGTTLLLIEKGIEAELIEHSATDKNPQFVADMISVQKDALEGIFHFVKQERELSTSYIKELHQVMLKHQTTTTGIDQFGNAVEAALLRGEWKKLPNNPQRGTGAPVHIYCPPESVASEMDRLISMHHAHRQVHITPEVEAAWLHHRFTQIHPFQDGNGRIARAIASLIFLRASLFPLSIDRDSRSTYMDALNAADKGDLSLLVSLFVQVQKKYLLKALSISETVLKDRERVADVIGAAVERLQSRVASRQREHQKVFAFAGSLQTVARDYWQDVSTELTESMRQVNDGFMAVVDSSDEQNDTWFMRQIVEVARQLNYDADTRTYRAWVRLQIREERCAEIVLSFHSVGTTFVGILVASAFVEYRDRSEDGQTTIEGPYVLGKAPFEFSYLDEEESLRERFSEWFRHITLLGLDEWRRQL